MPYTSTAEVRTEAGFSENQDFPPNTITTYLTRANGVINSVIAARYNLATFQAGIAGSPAEEVVKLAERLYAAGLLLLKEYATEPAALAEGGAKVKQAKDLLEDITSGKLKLFNAAGVEFTRAATSANLTPVGYPDDSASVNDEGNTDSRSFTGHEVW